MILKLLLLTIVHYSWSFNLTYIIKRDGNKIRPSCLVEDVERYEAVGWVYPIPTDKEGIPNITTQFIPTINNEYNCKFSRYNICSKRWISRDWSIDDTSPRTKEFLTDYRWEELPTILISNNTKEFRERIEITNFFKSGVSVRANGVIELLICSGWNPYNYPCYHFNIDGTEIYLNKYLALPQDLNETELNYLEYYKADSNILSHDEWRNFVISFDENNTITLFDVNLNRILIQHVDDEDFNPLYLLVRSEEPSLWKFHMNEFLYTETTQTSQIGPQLTLSSKDLCISLLVSMCETCELTFFFYDNTTTRRILKQVEGSQNNEWLEINLKEENVRMEKINIFVETKLRDQKLNQTGFWAIDNVRMCNENEVKVTYLELNDLKMSDEEEDISCQLITKPDSSLKRIVYDKIEEIPPIHAISKPTSIELSWEKESATNEIIYFITYQADDICVSDSQNAEREKISGFLTTKRNGILIENLVPYTLYNITISTVFHEVDKNIQISTLETVEPTLQELPQNVQLRRSETAVYVSWQEVLCQSVFGGLIYSLTVSNEQLNFKKQLPLKSDIRYKIDGLQADTPYTLYIKTARRVENMEAHSHTMVVNFTTLPGVVEPVDNLELYSIDPYSASLRYDLPKNLNRVPTEIQVKQCYASSSSKCRSDVFKVKPCSLWPKRKCIVVKNLIPYEYYTFKLRIRNSNPFSFGKEANVSGFTMDRVPGAPINVRYETVDCDNFCKLNITWSHPYNENGTITSFNIIANSTDTFQTNDYYKNIQVYAVPNKTYLENYTYKVKLPYSPRYVLSLQSVNAMYKSDFTRIVANVRNVNDGIDQSPELLEITDKSLAFTIPEIDPKLEYCILKVIVQDFDSNKKVEPDSLEDRKDFNKLCNRFGNTWISEIRKITNNNTRTITIGNSKGGKIQPKTRYCVTFIITNKYKKSESAESSVVYHKILETPASHLVLSSSTSIHHLLELLNLLYLLPLLFLIPIGFFTYRYFKARRAIKGPGDDESLYHVYESLEEHEYYRKNHYDHLLHK